MLKARDDPGALVWLDIEGSIADERALLAKDFGLSPITLDTMAERYERAKFVEGHGYYYLVTHGLEFDPRTQQAATPKLDVVFAPGFLITAHTAALPWLDSLRQAIIRNGTEESLMDRGVPYLLHAVLNALVDSFFPVLEDLDDLIDELENAAVRDTSNAVQGRIFRIKRSLAQMRRVISPQVEVANSLITRTGEVIPREAEPYFADVHDHLVRAFEVLDSYRDLMSGLLDVYLTTVSNRLNAIMKQLTIIATIFLPITFFTGVLGQNFGHAPQVEHDAGYNFWIALGIMAAISAFQLWYFKRRGWIGK
jgi:magnesium transporter